MNLFPQDLRPRHHRRIVARRDYASVHSAGNTQVPASALDTTPRLGRLGRFWARGSGMSDEQAANGAPATANLTGMMGVLSAILGPIGSVVLVAAAHKAGVRGLEAWMLWGALSAGIVTLGFGPLSRSAFQQLHRALTVAEVEELLAEAGDDLERAFLRLTRDAVRIAMPDPPATELRHSIIALAEALERLPEVLASPVDTTALRIEAEALEAKGLVEADRVIGDSLIRRADALRRRAEAAERAVQAGKRTDALRAEIQAQIEALHEGLAAFSGDTASISLSDLTHLSEAVRRVAAEAVSSLNARAEVEALAPSTPESLPPLPLRHQR